MFWIFVVASSLLALPGFWMQPGVTESMPSAGLAYGAHCAVLFAVALASSKRARRLPSYQHKTTLSEARVHRLAIRALVMMFALTLVVIVVFGSYEVLLGRFDRGAFRAGLGILGPLFVIPVFYVGPGVLAFVAFHYRAMDSRSQATTLLLALTVMLCVIMGVSLGYKSSAVRLIIPFVIAIVWKRTSVKHVTVLGGFASFMAIGASYFLENRGSNSINYVYNRATLISARTPTFLYETYPDGLGIGAYWGTLRSAVSDDVVEMLGGPAGDTTAYNHFDFSRLVSMLEYGDLPNIRNGSFNTTSTVFGDGIVALGSPGFLLFSALAGLLVWRTYTFVARSLHHDQLGRAAMGLVFFNMSVLKWLSSGSPTSVVHIIVVLGLFSTWRVLGLLRGGLATRDQPGEPASAQRSAVFG